VKARATGVPKAAALSGWGLFHLISTTSPCFANRFAAQSPRRQPATVFQPRPPDAERPTIQCFVNASRRVRLTKNENGLSISAGQALRNGCSGVRATASLGFAVRHEGHT